MYPASLTEESGNIASLKEWKPENNKKTKEQGMVKQVILHLCYEDLGNYDNNIYEPKDVI